MIKHLASKQFFLYSLWGVLFSILVKDALAGYPFNIDASLRYVDDLLLILLYLWMSYELIKTPSMHRSVRFYLHALAIIFAFHVAQSMAGIDLLASLKFFLFLRDNFWFFPVLYFSIKYLNSMQLFKIINLFFFVQVLFVLFQSFYHAASYQELLWEDSVNGSLGANASHILAYSLILVLSVMASRNKIVSICFIASIVILASARSAIIFSATIFPAAFLFSKLNLKTLIITATTIIFMLVPAYNFLNSNFEATLNPSVLFSQQQKELGEDVGAARLSFLAYSISKVNTAEEIILGHGPASYSSRSAIVINGSEYNKFNNEFRFTNDFIAGGSTFNAWIVENGYVVTIILIAVFLYPVLVFRKIWYVSATFLVLFFGIGVQKLMESYSVGFLYWAVFAYFILYSKEKSINLSNNI